MKFKKYYFILILLCLFVFPKNVFATCMPSNVFISVCDSNECDFNDLEEAYNSLDKYYDDCGISNLTINIGEGNYYINSFSLWNIDSLTINGDSKEGTVIRVNDYFGIGDMYDIQISDLTLKSDNSYYALRINDSNTISLNNLLIDARNADFGLYLGYNDVTKVNGLVVRNAREFGIYNNQCIGPPTSDEPSASKMDVRKNILNVNNSDVSNNRCSILDGCDPTERAFEFANQKSMLTYDYNTTTVSNSKLSCAVAYGNDYYYSPPSIYIKSNNTWVEKPIYGENVVEEYDGRVIVDLEEDKTISLSKKDDLVIESIFDESASDIEWVVEDEAIAKVENGKIIPLKVGKTVLTASNGGVNYRINLVVTSDLLNNPKTLNIGYILIVLLVSGVIGRILYKKNYSK